MLSVIIPTYNRVDHLIRCLDSLNDQILSVDQFEVIVVVDGSPDDTVQQLEQFRARFLLRPFIKENAGQCAARNDGASIAVGEHILFLDDDILADPQLLQAHYQIHQTHTNVIAIGDIRLADEENGDWSAKPYAEEWLAYFQSLREKDVQPSWVNCYSGNVSLPRSALLAVGGFPLDLRTSFDVELGYRLAREGLEFVFVPEASAIHDDYKPYKTIAQELYLQGVSCHHISQKHPETSAMLIGSSTSEDERLRSQLKFRLLLWSIGLPLGIVWLIEQLGKITSGSIQSKIFTILSTMHFLRGVKSAAGSLEFHKYFDGPRILMYHAFCKTPQKQTRFVISAKKFRCQLFLLRRLGYRVISLSEYVAMRRQGESPTPRAVILTIDDGYQDVKTYAFPALTEHAMTVTLFVVTSLQGQSNQWDEVGAELYGRPLLSSQDLAQMKGVFSFGVHTQTHPRLDELDSPTLAKELNGSRRALVELESQEFDTTDQNFLDIIAYPYGAYSQTVVDMARQLNFVAGCTADPGINSLCTPLHELKRIEIYGTDSLLRFVMKLFLGIN